MEAPIKAKTVVIDGKVIEIKQLPPGPVDKDLNFDRWSHDDATISPDVMRSQALPMKSNWQSGHNPLKMGKNGRVGSRRASQ